MNVKQQYSEIVNDFNAWFENQAQQNLHHYGVYVCHYITRNGKHKRQETSRSYYQALKLGKMFAETHNLTFVKMTFICEHKSHLAWVNA